MEHLVQHAVTTIRERYGEPLSLDELARGAMVSKFHFLRLFTRVTGVTPGRFLSAVRLQEAKRLLLSTSLTVADIGNSVGYGSAGSFTRRFTESVGLSPTQYRKLSLTAHDQTPMPAPPDEAAPRTPATGTVTGVLRTVATAPRPVYVGAFESPIVQGTPVSWSNATTPGRFALDRVPEGTWYIHAVARGARPDSASDPDGTADPDPALLMATVGPVWVDGDMAHRLDDITLSPPDWTRPPVLSALAGLDPQPLAA